jgi:hypothetical protein
VLLLHNAKGDYEARRLEFRPFRFCLHPSLLQTKTGLRPLRLSSKRLHNAPALLLHYLPTVPYKVHNLIRLLQIDSEVFRTRTPSELFNRARGNRELFTIFSDALTMMFQRMFPPVGLTRQRTMKAESRPRPPGSFQSHLNLGLPGSAVYDLSTVRQQINGLKMLKRQMYGRAGIELLRARLLPEPEFSDP